MEIEVDFEKMKTELVTDDEWTRDMLDELGDVDPPRREDGWRTIPELVTQAKGMSEIQIRDRLEKRVKDGSYERIAYKRIMFYRPKR